MIEKLYHGKIISMYPSFLQILRRFFPSSSTRPFGTSLFSSGSLRMIFRRTISPRCTSTFCPEKSYIFNRKLQGTVCTLKAEGRPLDFLSSRKIRRSSTTCVLQLFLRENTMKIFNEPCPLPSRQWTKVGQVLRILQSIRSVYRCASLVSVHRFIRTRRLTRLPCASIKRPATLFVNVINVLLDAKHFFPYSRLINF